MGELLNSTIVKLVLAIALTLGSSIATYFVGTAGTVPEARVEAVREQRSEVIALVDFFATHCDTGDVVPPAVSSAVSQRLTDAAQMVIPVESKR